MKFARPELVLAMVAALGGAVPAAGQEITWPEERYNRSPADGDHILPLPCGGAMVFRAVDVPGREIFDDQKITLGGRDPERGYIEHVRPVFLSGTFREDDAWRYYLGKYEVTEAQYAALNGDCPDLEDVDADLPKVEVTMAETVAVAESYTEWLFENARDQLPHENETAGYVRLPTEEEWEYAARGGAAVGPAAFEGRLPPIDGAPEQSIVFCRTDCALEPVGLLRPNPLGLHDMLGNAAELVHGLFRLNRFGRLHGAAGAYVKRGGDFRSRLEQVHSGLRQEFSPVGKRRLRREPTTGFRLALVAPALPDRERLAEARDSWSELAETDRVTIGREQADPRAELETLADFTASLDFDGKDELNRRLLALSDVIDANIATRNEQRARAAREMLRVAVIAGLRLPEHQASLRRCEELLEIDPERYAQPCDQVRGDSDYDFEFYLDHLVRMVSEFPQSLLNEQIKILENEFSSRREKAVKGLALVLNDLETLREFGTEGHEQIVEGWREAAAADELGEGG
ncbi:MAG: formylglycine-generating enzyme family protein [Geminicoccaceae bacterium]